MLQTEQHCTSSTGVGGRGGAGDDQWSSSDTLGCSIPVFNFMLAESLTHLDQRLSPHCLQKVTLSLGRAVKHLLLDRLIQSVVEEEQGKATGINHISSSEPPPAEEEDDDILQLLSLLQVPPDI